MKRLTLLFLLFLMFGISAYAVCPAGMPQTDVYYTNGIWTTRDEGNRSKDLIKSSFLAYASQYAKAKLPYPDCVTFNLAYNTSEGHLKDVLETFGLLTPQYSQSLSQNKNSLSTLSSDMKQAVIFSVEAYGEGLKQHLLDYNTYGTPSIRAKTTAETDLERLVNYIVASIKNNHKAVLIAHSEGNLFANAAYDNVVAYQSKYFAGLGITLPDTSRLEVIGVATPADHVADRTEINDRDGNQRYTTHCLDFIQDMPNSLRYNSLGISGVDPTDYAMCATHTVLGWIGTVQTYLTTISYADKLAKIFLGQNPGVNWKMRVTKANVASAGLSIADWIMSHTTHFMDAAYLNISSPTFGRIMRDIAEVLPNPDTPSGCLWVEAPSNLLPYAQTPFNWNLVSGSSTSTAQTWQSNQALYGNTDVEFDFLVPKGVNDYSFIITTGKNKPKVAEMEVDSVNNAVRFYGYSPSGITTNTTKLLATDFVNYKTNLRVEWSNGQLNMYLNGKLQLQQAVVYPPPYYVQLYSTIIPPSGSSGSTPPSTLTQYTPLNAVGAVRVYRPGKSCVYAGGQLTPATPTMTMSPATAAVSIVAGQSGYVDLTLTSKNGLTGNPNQQMYCPSSGCPANFSYNFPQGTNTNLPANGSIPIRVTFAPAAAATPGTYVYSYQAVLGSVTAVASITVTVTSATAQTGTVNVTATKDGAAYSGALSCMLSKPSGTVAISSVPYQLTSAALGTYSVSSCSAPTGTTVSSVTGSQTLAAGGSVNFVVALKTNAPTTGTIYLYTTNNVPVSCQLSGNYTTAPQTLTNKAPGSYTLASCTASGYTITSITPSATQTLSAGGSISFTVNLQAVPTTGTVAIVTTNNIAVSCSLSGASVTAPTTLYNQSTGSKTLSCSSPSGYTVSSITPSSTQTLSAGSTLYFTVSLTAVQVFSANLISYSPNPAKTTTPVITIQFVGSGLSYANEVYVFGGKSCGGGCKAAIASGSINSSGTSMQALAQLREADNYAVKVRKDPSSTFVLAGYMSVQ